MPVLPTVQDRDTTLYIWKITEPIEVLADAAILNPRSLDRLSGMKSEAHRKGFLAVRMLLQEAGTSDHDLYYDEFGKPHLRDGRHISISHSHEFSALAISPRTIGIDLEMRRDKIAIIAHKFVEPGFVFPPALTREEYITCLTVDWGIKESIFKIRNEPGISFKDHISVTPFHPTDGKTRALLTFNGIRQHYEVSFREVESYMLVYAFEDNA